MTACRFNIAAVERDTGLSKDVLRMWERRYGFPTPERDAHGERLYPAAQLQRLHLIKRLIDQGHRPGKLMAASDAELMQLAPRRPPVAPAHSGCVQSEVELTDLLALITRHDASGYQHAMQQRLARQGLLHFVQDTVAPLTQRVGEAWQQGQLQIFEEHLFTELTQRQLRQAIATLPTGTGRPRIVLTTVPEEPHALGLLMVETLLALEGAACIALGTQMPLTEIARAANAHHADVVALSFSAAFPRRQLGSVLQPLRQLLPSHVALWAGGAGVAGLVTSEPGQVLLHSFDDALHELAQWRATHLSVVSPGSALGMG